MRYPVFKYIRGKRTFKVLSVFMIVNLLSQTFLPTVAFALTSGPGQEEYSSFEPVETTEMVDPYSGDFTYNLPLLSVPGPNGGYPINLAYHSGIGMDQEASWVGLGWNISVGAINRQMRGLPDDLKGNTVNQLYHLKPSLSFGLDIPMAKERELYGFPLGPEEVKTISVQPQIYYNNYK